MVSTIAFGGSPASDNRITDKGVCALASSPYLRSLTDLDLSDNPIGDEGALALAAAPHLAGLKFLHLGQIDRELISDKWSYSWKTAEQVKYRF